MKKGNYGRKAGVLLFSAFLYTASMTVCFAGADRIAAEETAVQDILSSLEQQEIDVKTVREGSSTELKDCQAEIELKEGQAIKTIPIKVGQAGCLFLHLEADKTNTIRSGKVGYQLFQDKACSQKSALRKVPGAAADGMVQGQRTAVVEPGVYYLKVFLSDKAVLKTDCVQLSVGAVVIPEEVTLLEDQWMAAANIDSVTPLYLPIECSNESQITFLVQNMANTGQLSLCNQDKKIISKVTAVNGKTGKANYAVTGGIYYLRVVTKAPYIRVKMLANEIEGKTGNNKKQASLLEVGGKEKAGIFTLEDSVQEAQWFKFKNNKEQKIEIYYKGKVMGGELVLEFYKGKTNFGSMSLSEKKEDASFSPTSGTMGTKTLPAGTYYMKVVKNSTKVSGNYTIRVK